MAPQRCEVPISIVAVQYRIEVAGHIDWLYNELNIHTAGNLNHFFRHVLISFLLFLLLFLFLFTNGWNDQMFIVTPQNVQFEDASFLKRGLK